MAKVSQPKVKPMKVQGKTVKAKPEEVSTHSLKDIQNVDMLKGSVNGFLGMDSVTIDTKIYINKLDK